MEHNDYIEEVDSKAAARAEVISQTLTKQDIEKWNAWASKNSILSGGALWPTAMGEGAISVFRKFGWNEWADSLNRSRVMNIARVINDTAERKVQENPAYRAGYALGSTASLIGTVALTGLTFIKGVAAAMSGLVYLALAGGTILVLREGIEYVNKKSKKSFAN